MRFSITPAVGLFLAGWLSLQCPVAQAQTVTSSVMDAAASGEKWTTPAPDTEEMILVGKITNAAGPLPGAVLFLAGTKQMAVTNAEGEFIFEVPANAGTLEARVTYAGFADETLMLSTSTTESTVNLDNAKLIVVSRKQQLKAYMKTAQREVKRDLKVIHQSGR